MREQNRRTRWFAFRRCNPIVIAIGIACGTIAVANVCGMAQEAEGVLVERIRFRDFSTARAIPGNVHVPSGASLLLTEMVNTQPRVFHMSLTNGAVFSCWQNSGDSREVPLPWMPGNSRESLFVDEDLSFGIVADDTRAVHREEGDHRVRGYTVSSVVADGVDGEFFNRRTIIARQIGETLLPEGDRRYILNSGDAFPSSFPPGVVVGVHNNTEGTLKLKTEVDGLGGVVSIAISLPAKTTLCFRTPREHAGLEASPFAGREWRAEDFYQDGIPLTYSFGAPGIWSGYADNPPRGGVVKEVDRVGWAMNATVVFNQAGRIPALARKDLAVRLVSQDGAFDVVHILPWKNGIEHQAFTVPYALSHGVAGRARLHWQLFTVDSARVEDVRSAIAKVPPLLTSSINTRYDRAVQIADGPGRQVYLDRPTQDVKPLQVEEIVVSEPPDGPLVLRPGLKSFSYVADPRQSQPIVLEVRQESKPDATGVLVKLVPARTKELANSVFVRLLPEHAPFLTETADEQALREQARQGSGP